MNAKETGATASGDKKTEKKDENFLTKTAHSIRNKVQGLKSKKTKDSKKATDGKSAGASGSDDKESNSSSELEQQLQPKPTTTSEAKQERASNSDKKNNGTSKSSGESSNTLKKDLRTETTGALLTSDMTSQKSSENKNKTEQTTNIKEPTITRVSAKEIEKRTNDTTTASNPSRTSTDVKQSSNTTAGEGKSDDIVHISLDGVTTVDELRSRLDYSVEHAKIAVDHSEKQIGLKINQTKTASTSSTTNKGSSKENQLEPIRLNTRDIPTVQELLIKLDKQPGTREVIVEDNVQFSSSDGKQTRSEIPSAQPSTSTSDNEDSSTAPKSILKTSQDPSSLDTSTKIAALEDDNVHVNIEGTSSTISTSQQHSEVIDVKSTGEQKQTPPPTSASSEQEKKTGVKSEQSDNVSDPASRTSKDEPVPSFHISEHEYKDDPNRKSNPSTKENKGQGDNTKAPFNNPVTVESSSQQKQKTVDNTTSEWI